MKDVSMDCIRLTGFELWTKIGVPTKERATAQRVLVDIEIYHPTVETGRSDDIGKGIDYDMITNAVVALGSTERKTVERLAEDIAEVVLTKGKPEGGVKITVTKRPDLPLESASVTIIRP
jgi:FolB domain-containing protein